MRIQAQESEQQKWPNGERLTWKAAKGLTIDAQLDLFSQLGYWQDRLGPNQRGFASVGLDHRMAPPALTLILPAYNESAVIRNTVTEAVEYFVRRGLSYEVIVVADGDDGTREIVMSMAQTNPAVRVMGSPERRGKGRGIREAVAVANGSIIGYADADNKVPIADYGQIEPWVTGEFDVVIGSRALSTSRVERKQPLYRRLGSQGFAFTMRAIVGLADINDTQCGFKFFKREVAVRLFQSQIIDGYMFDVEILSLAQRFGYSIKEVPIRWRDDRDSRLQLVAGNIRNVKDLLRIRASRQRFSAGPAQIRERRTTLDTF